MSSSDIGQLCITLRAMSRLSAACSLSDQGISAGGSLTLGVAGRRTSRGHPGPAGGTAAPGRSAGGRPPGLDRCGDRDRAVEGRHSGGDCASGVDLHGQLIGGGHGLGDHLEAVRALVDPADELELDGGRAPRRGLGDGGVDGCRRTRSGSAQPSGLPSMVTAVRRWGVWTVTRSRLVPGGQALLVPDQVRGEAGGGGVVVDRDGDGAHQLAAPGVDRGGDVDVPADERVDLVGEAVGRAHRQVVGLRVDRPQAGEPDLVEEGLTARRWPPTSAGGRRRRGDRACR